MKLNIRRYPPDPWFTSWLGSIKGMDRNGIVAEIKRIAAANGGKAPGRQRFENDTGIRTSDWYPHLWLRWSDALTAAGLAPNKLAVKFERAFVLDKYAALVTELGRVPLHAELRIKAREDAAFPSHTVFATLGGKAALLTALREHCKDRPEVLSLLPAQTSVDAGEAKRKDGSKTFSVGYVYLMKSGRHFKIGRTNSLSRRDRELSITIPVPPTTIHSIETDDPSGVEAYWHRRFAEKRGEGEWFVLNAEDVAAFKRWRKIS